MAENRRRYGRGGALVAWIRDIARFARGRLWWLGGLTVLAVGAESVGLLLLVPILKQAEQAGAGLEEALVLYVPLVALAAGVVAVRGAAVAASKAGYVDDLRRRLHQSLMAMEWRTFSRLQGAHLVHVVGTEAARTGQGVEFLLRLAGWSVEIPVLLAVALHLSPALTAASLGLAGLCLLLTRPLDRWSHSLGYTLGEAGRAFHADLMDNLAGMRVVRGLGLEDQRCHRFDERMAFLREARQDQQRAIGFARVVQRSVAAVAAAAAVWFGLRVLGMALAETVALMVVFARLLSTSFAIQDAWRTVTEAIPAYEAVQDLLTRCLLAREPVSAAAVAGGAVAVCSALEQGIRLEGVGFRYQAGHPAALTDVCAEIPARVMTALVGASGAGKSTLTDLLLGLTEPDQGRVLVDGQPLTGPFRRIWRRRVGYVPQDAFLFHETVRANLAMAAPETKEEALWDVLERVAAADFVRALPAGLDTVVGDRGGFLSGGQRQRLALARVLLTAPDLLILDEATSALDSESERHILATLEALRHELTIVMIAHRPSTVRGSNHVIVLDAGQVVATGEWAEVERQAAPVLVRLGLASS